MRTLSLITALGLIAGCAPSNVDLNSTRASRAEFFFNDPGSRTANIWNPDAVTQMVQLIDSAQATLDFAVMGFSKTEVVDAVERAYDRGVHVRMVGDAGHLYNSGYTRMLDRHMDMVVGNLNHIMHDKFMVIDDRFVMAGTANWTPTDLVHNSNNFLVIDSPHVAADFTAEFEQMHAGVFGHSKVENYNGRIYEVGDTPVEVWFSPNEDAMGRILELVDGAQESIRFTIFAFTKDQVGSAFIRKQEEFMAKDLADGISLDAHFRDRRSVAGVIDQSQLHSNGQYHEVYRLLGGDIPLRMDGIDSSRQPGDYQAGGGRLHSKTMVIDADGEDPVVITGSFNWSASATQSNDEFLLVFRGKRAAQMYDEYFDLLWDNGRTMGEQFIGEGENPLKPGDVLINEVMWYGAHERDIDGFDEFVELVNNTNQDVRLDMWQLANPDDFVVGFPPGSVLPANGTFTVVDHVLEAYQDGRPQDQGSAYQTADMVVNAFNDNRQARLYLKDTAFELFLKDPGNTVMDVAGDGGPPFAGGPEGKISRSMVRMPGAVDGTVSSAWQDSPVTVGGDWVNDETVYLDAELISDSEIAEWQGVTWKEIIFATPGQK